MLQNGLSSEGIFMFLSMIWYRLSLTTKCHFLHKFPKKAIFGWLSLKKLGQKSGEAMIRLKKQMYLNVIVFKNINFIKGTNAMDSFNWRK